jgi:hypothetical protein
VDHFPISNCSVSWNISRIPRIRKVESIWIGMHCLMKSEFRISCNSKKLQTRVIVFFEFDMVGCKMLRQIQVWFCEVFCILTVFFLRDLSLVRTFRSGARLGASGRLLLSELDHPQIPHTWEWRKCFATRVRSITTRFLPKAFGGAFRHKFTKTAHKRADTMNNDRRP